MKIVYIKTTETCNLDCSHCFTSGSKGRKVFWNTEKVKNWITALDKHFNENMNIHFEFHGGEPFICKIEDLIDVASHIKSLKRKTTLSVTSNLVFSLTEKRLEFIDKYLDSLSTSWDAKMRFANKEQEELWAKNVGIIRDRIISKDNTFTSMCNTCVNRDLIEMDYGDLIYGIYLKNRIEKVRFERITVSGNAIINRDIIPTNKEVSDWLFGLYQFIQENNINIRVTNFEELLKKVDDRSTNNGTFLRNCEQTVYTLNADGTVSGCPNDAPSLPYATIEESIEDYEAAPKRIFQIATEQSLHSECYECTLFNECGGGCYKLNWDETGCPTPKKLLFHLLKRN